MSTIKLSEIWFNRFLQTVGEIAAENNSTTLFPIPIDLFAPFANRMKDTGLSGPTEEIMDEDCQDTLSGH